MSRHSGHVQHWTGAFQSGIIPKGISSPYDPEVDTKYEFEIKRKKTSKNSKNEKFVSYVKNELSECQNKLISYKKQKSKKALATEKTIKRIYL